MVATEWLIHMCDVNLPYVPGLIHTYGHVPEVEHILHMNTTHSRPADEKLAMQMVAGMHTLVPGPWHTWEWVTSQTSTSCHRWMRHVTHERVMSHTNVACHKWMCHVVYAYVMSRECRVACTNESGVHVWMHAYDADVCTSECRACNHDARPT